MMDGTIRLHDLSSIKFQKKFSGRKQQNYILCRAVLFFIQKITWNKC